MAFNNWPYTNFQDLNLGWILAKVKEALANATSAIAKSEAVESEVGTYSDRINAANAAAEQALNIARNANEILFIFADAENKAVNYVTWSQGESGYVTALDIYNAIVEDHKVPVFMDRNQYIYDMAGYETDPNSPLTITRFKFTKNGGNREDIVWIDRYGNITYTHIDGASGFPVVFNYIPSNPELQESGYWESDKTYAEIMAAINSGKSIFLTVKIDGETREIINNAYISKSSSGTYIALGYGKGFDINDSPYYTNTGNLLVYYTINSSEFVSVQSVFTVPSSSTQIAGRVLTVNSSGRAEWLPASGGTAENSIFLITAVYLNGQYTFDRNQADILSAIQSGKLPVVRYHTTAGQNDYHVYYEWVFDYYTYDGEDVYIYFSRIDQRGENAQLRWFASENKATEMVWPNLPAATGADDGKIPMVNSFGNYHLMTPSSSAGVPVITNSDSIAEVSIDPNKFYVFTAPDMLSIDFNAGTAGIVNEYHFRFTSGNTATALDLPTSVIIPDDFDVADNTVYEVSIIDNYMVYSSWAVSSE